MTEPLFIDLETYSEVPIKQGTYKYAENAEITLLAYAIGDTPVRVADFTAGEEPDSEYHYALKHADTVQVAHNSMFDRTVLRYCRPDLALPIERWHDTMVRALAHSLPGGLDKLCEIMGVPQDQAKLKTGHDLVMLFCKPRPKFSKIRRATRHTHPREWEEFKAYAANDIEAMRVLYRKLPRWNYEGSEMALWHLDQRINDRGFAVDTELVEAAIRTVAAERKRLNARGEEVTSDALLGEKVEALTQRDKLIRHILDEYDVALPDFKADTLERRLNDQNLPGPVRELLALRLEAVQTSTAKYPAIGRAVNKDGRMRGTLQFNGANRTGRWAGRTFQPQNLTRPDVFHIAEYLHINPKDVGSGEMQGYIDDGVFALKQGDVDMWFDRPMTLCSNLVRSVIVAPPGKKLCIADLSNIEGRVLAWLAGEQWKLDAYARGDDLYKLAYGRAFAVDPADVTKDQRQIGKVMELMLGYEGGVGAFVTGAATYGIDLDEMARRARPSIPDDVWAEAKSMWGFAHKKRLPTYGLSEETYCVCDSLKRMWRRSNARIEALWGELDNAVRSVLAEGGAAPAGAHLLVDKWKAWLRIRLPSGRYLCYPSPRIEEDGSISYMGMNQYSKRWSRIKTYGGKLAENVTQAASRDVLGYNMPSIENGYENAVLLESTRAVDRYLAKRVGGGYEIVLSVHDELITEAPDTPEFSGDDLAMMMSTVPDWAPGLPLAAAGFETYRYRKD